jgi:hypothetical protein
MRAFKFLLGLSMRVWATKQPPLLCFAVKFLQEVSRTESFQSKGKIFRESRESKSVVPPCIRVRDVKRKIVHRKYNEGGYKRKW